MSPAAPSSKTRASNAWKRAVGRAVRPVSLRGPVIIAAVALLLLLLANRPAAAARGKLVTRLASDCDGGTRARLPAAVPPALRRG